MAVVGFNGRGKSHIEGFNDQLVALCDCDSTVLGQTADDFHKKHGRKLDQIVDFRRLLDRKDIDAISIATPNHTHSLIAILRPQAGKDVYVEKPVSQRVWEGRQLVNASEKYKRMIQCGTQARSHESIRQAVEYVHSGKLGRIQYVIGTCYKPRMAIGKSDRPLAIPKQIDYELWCGPAAKIDLYRPERNSQGGYNPTTIGTGTTTPATATWATRASTKWILPAGSWAQRRCRRAWSVLAAGSVTRTPATRPTRKSCCTIIQEPRSFSKRAACPDRRSRKGPKYMGQLDGQLSRLAGRRRRAVRARHSCFAPATTTR